MRKNWKSQPEFSRGVRTGCEGWRSPLFEGRVQRASGPRRTHSTARGEEPGGLVGKLCAGGAPGKGRWENQELLGSGNWESFGEAGGLQRSELQRGIPKAQWLPSCRGCSGAAGEQVAKVAAEDVAQQKFEGSVS